MAGLQTSIQLQDRMSAVLNSITTSMSIMINSFGAAQVASNSAMDTAAFQVAQQEIVNASAALTQYQEELERVRNTPVPTPQAPVWQSVSSPQVFMNSGADRFASEYQVADQMAKQLYQRQLAITAQARNMRVTPPGMLNDVAAVSNRVQMLASRVQSLNQIPVNLRTEQTNNEMEALRGKLSQVLGVQENLNASMARMDISTANAAYRQLNAIVDTTERDIRNNLTAQEQFNQSLKNGASAASGLEGKIRSIAMSMAAALSAQKIIGLADIYTKTSARLDLMNYGLDTTAQLQEKIFSSAQRSRAAYQTTADAVAKIGMQARAAFGNNDELLAFVEQLNKNFVIAGTSVQGVDSVMLQLTQSLASGRLQGEELNAVLDNAQPIVQHIQDYLQNVKMIDASNIKKLASEGVITAQVIKDAMFYTAEETNDKFKQMPMTFGQVGTAVLNSLSQAFQPVIQMIGRGATFIYENWSTIAPVFYGLATGIMIAAVAWGIYTAVTWLAVAANQALIVTLLSNPFLWIAIVVAVIVAQIYKWVQAVGGLKVAWLMCVNEMRSRAESLALSILGMHMRILNSIDSMIYGFDSFKVGVLNALGNLKVLGLTILQNFINGAIDRINALIGLVSSISGISIELIGHVEFATEAALEEQAKQSLRAADLAAQWNANAVAKQTRQNDFARTQRATDDARMQRQADIAKAQNDAARKAAEQDVVTQYGSSGSEVAKNTGNTATNTAAMANSMDAMDEDLKYMRDAAEQEIINRFTLAELKVDVSNNNTLTTKTDFSDVNRMLADVTGEILNVAAEGGYL